MYQDHISIFQELSNKDKSISIHHGTFQVSLTKMFKFIGYFKRDICAQNEFV